MPVGKQESWAAKAAARKKEPKVVAVREEAVETANPQEAEIMEEEAAMSPVAEEEEEYGPLWWPQRSVPVEEAFRWGIHIYIYTHTHSCVYM